jgi:dihydrofolate reductase
MRKLIVHNIVSLDGYITGPGNNVMLLPMGEFFDAYCAERLGTADILLLGKNSYDMFRGFWPGVVDLPDATEDQKEISRRDNAIQKVVVSDTLTEEGTAPWSGTTTIVRRKEAHEQIAELKRGDGGDIIMFGSRTLWNDLLRAGLIDELHLMVGPVVLGGGTTAFAEGEVPALELVDTRRSEGSGNVLLRYAVGNH